MNNKIKISLLKNNKKNNFYKLKNHLKILIIIIFLKKSIFYPISQEKNSMINNFIQQIFEIIT